MTLLMKSWGWPNSSQKGRTMYASDNFHKQLHKYTVKVSKPPVIRGPSLQPLEVTHDIQLCHTFIYDSLHPSLLYSQCCTACSSQTLPHTKQAHIYIYIYIYICHNFWALDIWTQTYPKGLFKNLYNYGNTVIIPLAKECDYVHPSKIWTLNNIKLISLHLNLHTSIRTVHTYLHYTYACMYRCLWLFWLLDNGQNMGGLITLTTGNFPLTQCFVG
jgi:hypothetical protein